MSIADELQKLFELHRSGALTDAEYARAKAAVLAGSPEPPPPDALDPSHDVTARPLPPPAATPWARDAGPFLPPAVDLARPSDFRRPRRREARLRPTKTGSAIGGGCITAAGVVPLIVAAFAAAHEALELTVWMTVMAVVLIACGTGVIILGFHAAEKREAARRGDRGPRPDEE
jgi:hypothetical protein